MAQRQNKICPGCDTIFKGSDSTKTCSARCRKRLQRAKVALANEAEVIKESAQELAHKVEVRVEPSYASEGGYVSLGAKTATMPTQVADEQELSSPIHPWAEPLTPPANSSNPSASVPAYGSTLQPPSGFMDKIWEDKPSEEVKSQPETPSQTTNIVHHHHYGDKHEWRKIGAIVGVIALFAGGLLWLTNRTINQTALNQQSQSQTIQKLAQSLNQNPIQTQPDSTKIDFNVDTSITGGKKLTATGQVAIQNEADSTHAFTVQNAAGTSLLVADTTNNVVSIGDGSTGTTALKVNGDIVATGAITSNGAVLSSGGLSANNGSTALSNSGLTIQNVLICTASGCVSSKPIPNDIADIAYTNAGQTFTGDNTFSGQTTFKAISTKAFQIQNATGTDNIFYVDTNNNRIGIGTVPNKTGAALQVAGGIDLSTGAYQVGGTSGASLACSSGYLLQQAIIQGGIVTSGSCVAVAGVSTPSLQQVYDASTPAKIGLSSASGQFQIQDSASPLGTNLFSVTNNGATTTYFAVNGLGISVTGNVNTTGQYQINGTQIASTDLGDSSNLGRLAANQTFSGANTFNNVTNSFTGNGSGLTGVNASKLNNQSASYYTDAGSLSTGTLNSSRLSTNVTQAGNTFNGASQLVQLTGGGLLPILSGANLTNLNANNISSGTLGDSHLSGNVALLNASNIFVGNNSFHLASAALTVQDASSPLGTDLFEVTDNAGTTKYLAVSASGVTVNGYNVCTTAGNCAGVGGGVTTVGGTANQLAKFTASNGIGDSIISDNGSTATIAGDLAANNITQNGSSVCDTSGNCVGVSGGGVGGSGTAGKIALFTGTGFSVGDSILTQASTTVTAAGNINATGTYELNGTQVDSTILSNDGNLAKLNGTQTFSGANTFSNASNVFAGDGSGLTGLDASNILTGTLDDAHLSTNVAFLGSSQTFAGVNNFSNAGNTFTGDGSGLTALGAGNISTGTLSDSRLSNNVALLNGTGPQTFSGNNKFTGTVLAANTGASAFIIQNAAGSSKLFVADTSNTRIAIAQATASYTLDVAGDINTSTGFRVGGSAGTGITCTSGNVIQNPVIVGGIITGGTCVANGGGSVTTLQDAYNNSSSPAMITTSSATKGILVKAGSGDDSANLFQIQNAAGKNMINVNSATASLTVGGGTSSTTALQVQNASGATVLGVDTSAGQVNIGTLSVPGTITAMLAPATPTVTPNGTAGSTSYSYEVTAVSANGSETLASTAGTTNTGNGTLSSTNYNAISWGSAGATRYMIYRTGGGSTQGLIGSTTSTSFNDTGYIATNIPAPSLATSGSLATSTTYYYKVTALDNTGGQTLASSEVNKATSSTYTSITLSWAPVAGARSYRVYRGTTSGGENVYYTSYTSGYSDTGGTGTGASLPTVSNASTNNLGNSTNTAITLGNGGTAVGQLYVAGSLPTSPLTTLNGVLSTISDGYLPYPVVVSGSYAYVAAGAYSANKLQIIDISNPLQPIVLGSAGALPGINNIIVSGNYAYISAGGGGEDAQIIDISNKSNPQLLSNLLVVGQVIDMSLSGHYLYVINQAGYLYIMDVSNPNNPAVASSTKLGSSSAQSAITVSGNYAYVSVGGNLTILDVSNPASPTAVSNSAGFGGYSGDSMTVKGSYLYVARYGLFIYNVSNPATPFLVGYDSNGGASGTHTVTVSGRYAYLGTAGWDIEDISNLAHPYSVGSYASGSGAYPSSVAIQGRYLYTADEHQNKFSIFDMGGEYAQNLEVGSTETDSLQVDSNESVAGSSSIQGGLSVGQGLQVAGDISASGNFDVVGSLSGSGISAPTAPTVTPTGTPGSTSYSYEVAAVNATSGSTLASAAGSTSTGNATLSSANYNHLAWSCVLTGPIGAQTYALTYNVYRTAGGGTQGFIGSVTYSASGCNFNDAGLAASGSTPSANASGSLTISGGTQIQNSNGSSLLTADTNNMRIAIDATYSLLSLPDYYSSPYTSLLTPPSTPTITPTGTTGSTNYSYEVAARVYINGYVITPPSTAGSTTTGNATLTSSNYNAISWASVSGASTYYIYRTVGGSTQGLMGTTSGTSFNDTGLTATTPTPAASGLTSGTTYYYKVTAVGAADSSNSETNAYREWSITTTASNQGIAINWSAVPGASSYRVYRGTTSNGEVGYYNISAASTIFADSGYPMDNSTATPPTANTAYKSTNISNNNLQLTVGGNGTPTGQVYISGTVPTSALGNVALGNAATAMATQGNYAYILSNTHLQIVDIGNPSTPVLVGSVSTASSGNGVYVAGHYAYVVGNSSFNVIDIANPAAPTVVSTTGVGIVCSCSVTVQGKYAYIAADPGLTVFDISNPNAPTQIYVNSALTYIHGYQEPAIRGSYLYAATYATNPGLSIVDISHPASPAIVGSGAGSAMNTIGVVVSGRYAYVSTSGTLQVFDISNPTTPTLVSSLANAANGFYGNGLSVQGRYVYAIYNNSINVIDVSNPAAPYIVGNIPTSSSPYSVSVQGRYAYVASHGASALQIFDLGGEYTQSLEAGSAQADSLTVSSNETVGGSSNIQGGLSVGQQLQVGGDVGIVGSLNIAGGLNGGNGLSIPTVPTISNLGTSGSTTYNYAVSAVLASGASTLASSPASTTSGNATLNSSNFNRVYWIAVPGAARYNVYRTVSGGSPSSTGLIGNTASTSFDDTGLSASGSLPTVDGTGSLSIYGAVTTTGSSIIKSATNSTTAFQIQNSSGTSLLTADTSGMTITLGSASSTPVLLVLGNKNTSGDPTCTNGAIYYNSNSNQFRGCANGTWGALGSSTTAGPGYTLDYSQGTSNVSVSSSSNSTEGTAQTLVTGNSTTYSGTPVTVTFFAPGYDYVGSGGSGTLAWGFRIVLYRDSTVVGQAQYMNTIGGISNEGNSQAINVIARDTPSAGSHTYTAKAFWISGNSASASIYGGTGGSGAFLPMFLQVTQAN